jgi:hypothetical protein
MSSFFKDLQARWFFFIRPKLSAPTPIQEALLTPLTPEESRQLFRKALTDSVEGGWKIEIENELDAVLSKKPSFNWFGSLVGFVIFLLIYAPLALFFLVVVIIRGVTRRDVTRKIWIDDQGRVQRR